VMVKTLSDRVAIALETDKTGHGTSACTRARSRRARDGPPPRPPATCGRLPT
jgi:hypothetical protein